MERTPDDIKIDEITHYVLRLESYISRVARAAEALVKSSKDSSKAVFELGLGMTGERVIN